MAVRNMLCTHCGKPTVKSERWWFELGRMTDGMFMTVDTPMHRDCADISFSLCPRLDKISTGPVRWPEGAQVIVSIVGGVAVEQDFGLRITSENPVVGHLKFGWGFDPLIKRTRPLAF
jgi:hypothetical protein